MRENDEQQATITRGNLTYVPVVPAKLEFALHVRETLLRLRPAAVAVELPTSLADSYRKAIERMPRMSVILLAASSSFDEEEHPVYLPVEPADPFIEALRTAVEISAETMLLEPPSYEKPHVSALYPSAASVNLVGAGAYVHAYRLFPPPRTRALDEHAAGMAWKLQGADPLARTCVVVALNMLDPLLDAMEQPQDEPPLPPTRLFASSRLFNLHPECLAEVTSEAPFYQELYESVRISRGETASLPRSEWQLKLLREAEREYEINAGERVKAWQRIALAKFARNLALLDRELLPGAYDLTVAARSLADDNYAYEVWEMANRFSAQQTEEEDLETLNISGEEVWLRTRKLQIRRRLPKLKQRLRPSGLAKRKREKAAGDWAKQTSSNSICSYPPEDLVIENYNQFVKQQARSMLSTERTRVEPFTTSSRDGVDLRETIRNWHEGKLYVRDLGRSVADVGAVVIIFNDDRQNSYTYLTTWLGEHQNESDMAFYSTEPFSHLVGPGIGRAEYGGLLMTLPPRRLYDVWSDPDYAAAETKAEVLLMAGIDYSTEQHVIYVAAKPPRSHFRTLAARLNRKIVYVPLGQLSPAKLKKIRVVHVLDSYERRSTAKQYIW